MAFIKNNKIFIILAGFGAVGLILIFYLLISANRGINLSVNDATAKKTKNAAIIKTDDTASDAAESVFARMEDISKADHLVGPIDAPVKIIVYSEYDCLFCADFNDTLKKVKAEYGDKAVVAYRHFPQRQHVDSLQAALISECAAEQNKFLEMNDKLFDLSKAGKLGDIDSSELAKELNLDEKSLTDCVTSEKYKTKISDEYDNAKNFGIIGAPSTFVNGEVLPGAVQFEDFTDSAGIQREGMKSVIARQLNFNKNIK
jgi:protein-disulfide isomerase